MAILVSVFITNCTEEVIDQESIISQLPSDKSIILLPNSFTDYADKNNVTFAEIDSIHAANSIAYTEENFYTIAYDLGVKYIIIPSEMIEENGHSFEWIVNKKFRACPGTIEHISDRYFVFLVYDNAKNSYTFHKFLYEIKNE